MRERFGEDFKVVMKGYRRMVGFLLFVCGLGYIGIIYLVFMIAEYK